LITLIRYIVELILYQVCSQCFVLTSIGKHHFPSLPPIYGTSFHRIRHHSCTATLGLEEMLFALFIAEPICLTVLGTHY